MKESELEIKELNATRESMSATGNKTFYPAQCSDIFVYIVANAEGDKQLQRRITGLLKEAGVKGVTAKNAAQKLKKALTDLNDMDKAYTILANLHPDKELIEKYGKVKGDSTHEACGCGMMAGTGEEPPKVDSKKELSTASSLITAGVIIAGFSILTAILLKD